VTHVLAPAGQRHSVHNNEWEDHVYSFDHYIVINIIVEAVKYNFFIIIRYKYHVIIVNIANNIFSMLASILALCEIYLTYTHRVHWPRIRTTELCCGIYCLFDDVLDWLWLWLNFYRKQKII
jgi:hypothetical protein